MSRYSGPQSEHAARRTKELKRAEATQRDLLTKPERRSNKRGRRVLHEVFEEATG